jgi:hypothetical protein
MRQRRFKRSPVNEIAGSWLFVSRALKADAAGVGMVCPRTIALALAVTGLGATAAFAESVPFRCTILEDGKSVRINVSNPARAARSCLVSCRFTTPHWGGESQIMCAHMVPARAKDIEMCTKTSGGVRLLQQTHGSADCIRR